MKTTNYVHLHVKVRAEKYDLQNNQHHCPISHTIAASDPDITNVRSNRDFIKFSRKSTGKRYIYRTPPAAVAFIDGFDDNRRRRNVTLTLTLKDLVTTRERSTVSSRATKTKGGSEITVKSKGSIKLKTTAKSRRPSSYRESYQP